MGLAFTSGAAPAEIPYISLFAGIFLSLLGSLPPGMISLSVAQASVRKGLRPAIMMAIGASLVEVLQARISFQFGELFGEMDGLKTGFNILAAVIFGCLGSYFMVQKPTAPKPNAKAIGNSFALLSGAWVSSLNVLAFPYWIFYGTYLEMQGLSASTDLARWSLSLGVGIGTFGVLGLYAVAGQKLTARLPVVAQSTHRIVGGMLLGLSLIQIISLLPT